MRHIFMPEKDEICITATPSCIKMRLENRCGDTFVIQFDEDAIDHVIRRLLAVAWEWQLERDLPKENAIEDVNQEKLRSRTAFDRAG